MNYNFSVLLSIYYKENSQFFDAALNSIYTQTYLPNEVIIVHDGKLTSELYSVIEKWEALLPIQNVILDNNCGLGIALNIGLEQCSNDIVMRADTDDINLPNRFEIQYKYMTQNPEITLCGSHVNEFEASSDEIIRVKKVPIGDNIVKVIKKEIHLTIWQFALGKTYY